VSHNMPNEDLLSLSDAAREIRQICEQRHHERRPRPFFFVVGAGTSFPTVPLAWMMAMECRATALVNGVSPARVDLPAKEKYSYWFSRAFPQPEQRQNYLEKLMDHRLYSSAVLALANLLGAEHNTIGNVVVTPNFDTMVSGALRLLGHREPLVCGQPASALLVDPACSRVQIIHVHGTYLSYDCCNLGAEMRRQERAVVPVLTGLLTHSAPLVIGYSGWDDPIMTALHRRLKGRLPCNLYWFCHCREDYERLKPWLRRHPDCRFVLPTQFSTLEGRDVLRALARATGVPITDEHMSQADRTDPCLASSEMNELDERLRVTDTGAEIVRAIVNFESKASTTVVRSAINRLLRADYDQASQADRDWPSGREGSWCFEDTD